MAIKGVEQKMRVVAGVNPSTGDSEPLPIVDGAVVVSVTMVPPEPAQIVTIVPFAGAVNVSVLTPLFALTQVPGNKSYVTHQFGVYAHNATKDIHAFIDMSMNGVDAEPAHQTDFVISAGQGGSFGIGPWPAQGWWALSAESSDGSVQPVTFAWTAIPG